MLKLRKLSLSQYFDTKGANIKSQNLSIHHLSKTFLQAGSRISIFSDTSYEFVNHRSYAIMAPSGVGKSTLLHMLAGIDHPSAGLITLGKQHISCTDSNKRTQFLQHSISIVLQQSYLIYELTVIENVMLKAIIQHQCTDQDKQRALQLLTEIGLEKKADCFPGSLSGGQQQKIALLRAIFQVPQFLLADEPTGNLDEISGNQTIQLLLHYQKKYAMGLIISTHDIKIAQQCDTIVRIEHQKLY